MTMIIVTISAGARVYR